MIEERTEADPGDDRTAQHNGPLDTTAGLTSSGRDGACEWLSGSVTEEEAEK